MPGEIEIARSLLREAAQSKPRQDAVEIAPMQHVELAEGNPARADLLHRALIFAAPGFREREPIKRKPKWLENALGFPRNSCAPVDERSENIKEQRPCGHDQLRHCRAATPGQSIASSSGAGAFGPATPRLLMCGRFA
jgi:hypothetical protein